ncbi:MAG: class III poly(R)-hydroxyalkanoic acid synthase subunit PhaE [Gammaproteobacteria bacterium]|nr:class III poly(R)-hydroxyalkanoic acid synthase subunit PhaE [Gammaproteobacteria bacterium]
MSETNPWAAQWFNAQQQFVDSWSDMAKSGIPGNSSQSDLWAQSFDLWRKASGAQVQPDFQQAMDKCMEMGKGYFAMAEQVSKSMSTGVEPAEAINQWMDQLKQSLQQFGSMPGFDGSAINGFMKQWFNPTSSWQQMTAGLMPMNQGAWQLPGMNTPSFNLGEMVDPLGTLLEAPGVGYFREPQAKQQKGLQLALEYQQANQAFNQAFLRIATESIQGFQARILKIGANTAPKSLRELYDLWVEISEEHYAEFAMGEEYQELYGDMVNRLMIVKKHYSEITDDMLRAMNLPNTREVDTMQERLQQMRRDNFALKKEISEIKSMLQQVMSRPTAAPTAAPAAAPAAKKAPRKSAARAAAATAPGTAAKSSVKKSPVKAVAKSSAKKSPAKTVAKKATPQKKSVVTKASKGA